MLKTLSGETTFNHIVNLMSTFFKKLCKNRKRLENVNGVLYRIFYDHTGLESHNQIVVPNQVILEIIRSLHNNPIEGHPTEILFTYRKISGTHSIQRSGS